MKRLLFVVLALSGCNKVKTDYSETKLVTETLTIDGVTFTVDIPEGLPKSKRDLGMWSDARMEYDYTPKVFTGVSNASWSPTELEDVKQQAPLSSQLKKTGTFARVEQKPDRWALTLVSGDKHEIEAITLTKVGDKVINCHATQDGDPELPSYDKTKAMLEAICDSIKAK
jgi:hypothetical protein